MRTGLMETTTSRRTPHSNTPSPKSRDTVSQWMRCVWSMTVVAVLAMMMVIPANGQEKLQLDLDRKAATGGDGQPMLVMTLGSLNKLMNDMNYLSAAVGQPQAGATFGMMSAMFAQGLDMDQPIGLILTMVDGMPQPTAFLPIENVKRFLKQLEATIGPTDELDDGTIVISIGANTVYVKQQGKWAVAAKERKLVNDAPKDPTSYFAGLGNDYDIAFRVKVQEVPAGARDMLVGQLRQGFEQALEKQSAEEAKATREMGEMSIEQIDQFFREADELMVGMNASEPGKQVVIDTLFTCLPGTKMAALYGGSQSIPSAFASVIRDDAAAYYHAAFSLNAEAIELADANLAKIAKMMDQAIGQDDDYDDADQADLKELVARVSGVISDSFKEGKADIGVITLSGPKKLQFAMGMFVADGNEVSKILKDTAAKLEKRFGDDSKFPTIQFDQETYNGVALHVVEREIPAGELDREVWGDKVQIHIGTSPKALYLAAGKGSLGLVKELIDSSSADSGAVRPLGQMKVKLLPFLELAQTLEDKDEIAAIIDTLLRANEPGVIQITQDSIPNGQRGEFTISEGVLKAIGAAIQAGQRAKMHGGF